MPTKRELTREKIVTAASEGFRSQGFAGIGVDGIAKAAGVTSGAFYSHLGSKNGAFEAALNLGLDEVIDGVPVFQQQGGINWMEDFTDYYLGLEHRQDLARGCAMTTLSPEVVRTTEEMHEFYQSKMKIIIDLMIVGIKGDSEDDRRGKAWTFIGCLIGALTLCRAVNDPNLVQLIAASAKQNALSICEACEVRMGSPQSND
ncbi:MAG: TetR/AcrR family transcriptional regulator [Kangiellaceae bacterium]|nr:TetR/AcrR family transcriptional regulator [Kangiellaceae bacterium]